MKNTDYDEVESKTELVVYGVGNFSSSLIAKQQLDLVSALRRDLKISKGSSYCYDPVFTQVEIKALTQLGWIVPNENEEGKRNSKNKCIYYLPHCGKSLYNNILWSNWSVDTLPGIIIIGNSFTAITDRTPKRLLEKCGGYILKIQPYTTEIPLPTRLYKDNDVFNDISIHVFTRSNIQTLSDVFWTDVTEPVYTDEDSDFISAKKSTSVIK
ncbi:hypothetical protein LOTGIDRAFT_103688 [Lottia gigantea]|uniref:SRR1-like domain-containing protein n=1 Tax=Lottia gigantea TaxID=225164 RepID=V4A279_LOTGI|nr:hypothetical protein LOTGIDRAFT_103688 [Lottia gigantea]ESO97943.1 hypothetical protein LOTGIDRAFT_103688 [Lottia gigantea]